MISFEYIKELARNGGAQGDGEPQGKIFIFTEEELQDFAFQLIDLVADRVANNFGN